MLLANLLQGERFGRTALLAVAGAVTALVLSVNLISLKDGRDTLMMQSVYTRSDLGAIEIAKRTVDPGFWLNSVVAGTPTLVNVEAGKYLEAVDDYGSPAYHARPNWRLRPTLPASRPTSSSARRCRSRPSPTSAPSKRGAASPGCARSCRRAVRRRSRSCGSRPA